MAIVERLLESRALSADAFYIRGLTGWENTSGVYVDHDQALSSTAVLAGVKRIAGDVASTPLKVLQATGDRQKRIAIDEPAYRVLHDDPNPEMTPQEFREMVTGFQILYGNGYAEIVRSSGKPDALWPIPSYRVTPKRTPTGRLYYAVHEANGQDTVVPMEDMFHLRGFVMDGVLGFDLVTRMREAIGLGLAQQEYSARFFGSGSQFSGVLKHPKHLSKEGHEKLVADFQAKRSGLANMHRAILLEEGMDWTPTSITPEAAQMIESRKFSVTEVSRMLLIPPHLVGDLERATFSNVEQQFLEYLQLCLRHYFTRWEQTANKRLLLPSQRPAFYTKHNTAALLSATLQERYNAYQVAIQNAILSPNDVRGLEDLDAYDGGDEYFVPLNLQPVSMAMEPPPTPAPPPSPAPGTNSLRSMGPEYEQRAMTSVLARRRLRKAHRPLIREAAAKVVNREARQVRRLLPTLRDGGLMAFNLALTELYDQKLEPYVRSKLMPSISALGLAVFNEASNEVSAKPDPVKAEAFAQGYVANTAARHVGSSKRQIAQIIKQNATLAATADAIEQRLDEWVQTRPDKMASRESVESSGAFSKLAYIAAGVTLMRWVSYGESCPLCMELDGTVVGVESAFLPAGQTLNAEGTSPLTAERDFTHPPIHNGCDCDIVAG